MRGRQRPDASRIEKAILHRSNNLYLARSEDPRLSQQEAQYHVLTGRRRIRRQVPPLYPKMNRDWTSARPQHPGCAARRNFTASRPRFHGRFLARTSANSASKSNRRTHKRTYCQEMLHDSFSLLYSLQHFAAQRYTKSSKLFNDNEVPMPSNSPVQDLKSSIRTAEPFDSLSQLRNEVPHGAMKSAQKELSTGSMSYVAMVRRIPGSS